MEGSIALKKVLPFFPTAEVYKVDELIIEPKNNIYFIISDIRFGIEFDCKMIEWLSRPAHKGLSDYWQAYVRRGLNSYFRQTWSKEDLDLIYTKLGNNVNRKLCWSFVNNNFDMSILKETEKNEAIESEGVK
jgi:hypothetical protein